jgi:hypothetical protein
MFFFLVCVLCLFCFCFSLVSVFVSSRLTNFNYIVYYHYRFKYTSWPLDRRLMLSERPRIRSWMRKDSYDQYKQQVHMHVIELQFVYAIPIYLITWIFIGWFRVFVFLFMFMFIILLTITMEISWSTTISINISVVMLKPY